MHSIYTVQGDNPTLFASLIKNKMTPQVQAMTQIALYLGKYYTTVSKAANSWRASWPG